MAQWKDGLVFNLGLWTDIRATECAAGSLDVLGTDRLLWNALMKQHCMMGLLILAQGNKTHRPFFFCQHMCPPRGHRARGISRLFYCVYFVCLLKIPPFALLLQMYIELSPIIPNSPFISHPSTVPIARRIGASVFRSQPCLRPLLRKRPRL